MSKFAVEKINSLTPYTPGEQPKNMEYIKLNTNEFPYPPAEGVKDFSISVNLSVKEPGLICKITIRRTNLQSHTILLCICKHL